MGAPLWTKEEDATLKQFAGIKTASEIAIITGRPKNGVHHRIEKLGLDGRMTGEKHWNAKLSNIQSQMIGVLYDAGFTSNEIYQAMTNTPDISLSQICNICACRSRINNGTNNK